MLSLAEGMEVHHLCLLRLVHVATTGKSFKGVLSGMCVCVCVCVCVCLCVFVLCVCVCVRVCVCLCVCN